MNLQRLTIIGALVMLVSTCSIIDMKYADAGGILGQRLPEGQKHHFSKQPETRRRPGADHPDFRPTYGTRIYDPRPSVIWYPQPCCKYRDQGWNRSYHD